MIAPKVAGFIAEVAVTDNQAVHAGDLLVKLDDRDYKAALARAMAAVAGQQATLANLDARRQLQQAMIAQAQAELAATAAEIARAKYDVDRYRSLIQGQYASLQRFQQADADYKKATAADQKARAAVTAAERELDVIDTQKQQTQADLAAAIADRDTAQLNLCYTELRAPIDGVIGNRSARRGAFAPVGAQLISLVPAEGLWIDANFKESQLARHAAGIAGADRGRRAARRGLHRPCRQPGAGDRGGVQHPPAGERDRQFHQDRAARAGADPARWRRREAGPAAPGPLGHGRRRRARRGERK